MKAIQTKYIPATDTKGSRIKAWMMEMPAKTFDYNSLEGDPDHTAAVLYFWWLIEKQGLKAKPAGIISGTLPNGDGCHVFIMNETNLRGHTYTPLF